MPSHPDRVRQNNCDHEWVLTMIQMPEGYSKPGVTRCSKCGKLGHQQLRVCNNYKRPPGVLGGPCLICGCSQPEHAWK